MQEERWNHRDLTYSAWHRRGSMRRFVGIEKAQLLSMSDLDCVLFVETDSASREPLALVETARDVGQSWKGASVTLNLAKRAHIPAYVILYSCSSERNPANPTWPDIRRFRIKRLWPRPEHVWRNLSPSDWANALLRIRAWSAARHDQQAANDADYDNTGSHD